MMAGRQSKRLRMESPEITQQTYDCFICHGHAYTCEVNTVQLPCCKNFTHRRCQTRWERHSTCGLCRQPLPRQEQSSTQVTAGGNGGLYRIGNNGIEEQPNEPQARPVAI